MNPPRQSTRLPDAVGGFALIEGLIAILIFSLGILGLVGLQATTTQSTTLAKTRVDASFVASQRIADIWGDLANLAGKTETNTPIASLPEGKRTTKIEDTNLVTVSVTWKMPNDDATYSYTTVARIAGN
jgi:type IV pilus assembly protein PilV